MVTIYVRLFGALKLDGSGRGRPAVGDGSFALTVKEGSTVYEAMDEMRVPAARVGIALVNGRDSAAGTPLSSGDQVVLVPQEFAALWPAWLRQSLAARTGCSS